MKYLKKFQVLFVALVVGTIPLATSLRANADPLGNYTSYSLTTLSSLGVIAEATDGSLWTLPSSGQNGVVRMTKTGSSSVLQTTPNQYSFTDVTAGSDGDAWFYSSNRIGHGTPSALTFFSMPQALTASGRGLTVGPDGNIWFAQGDGDPATSRIGRMTPAGTFLPSYSIAGRYPTGVVSDPANGVMWYSVRPVSSSDPHKIGKFDMSGNQTEFVLPPTLGLTVKAMILGPDGNLWFINGPGKIAKMTPAGNFTAYDLGYSSANGLLNLTVGRDGYIWATRNGKTIARVSTSGLATTYTIYPTSTPYAANISGLVGGRDGNIWVLGDGPKQIVKVGTGYTDNDEDGLESANETLQGTSDSNPDSDSDGLSDYVESASYTVRDQVFCNQGVTNCEYPNPLVKDIYIENDWMEKPGTGGYSMQLTSNQVGELQTSFGAEGINLHIDTGQLGGATEVPYYSALHFAPVTGIIDFYDYKLGGDGISVQMSPLRKDIFHYLITGQGYADAPGSSGASYAGDDDFFVSFGNIKENLSYTSLDTAISGTVMHELGHGLCLSGGSSAAYAGQPASCRYDGVDTNAGPDYDSVMNYDYQLEQVDYSEGLNGAPDDHNDWNSIRLGDFAQSNAGDILHGSVIKKNPSFKSHKQKRYSKNERLIIGPKITKLKAAHRL